MTIVYAYDLRQDLIGTSLWLYLVLVDFTHEYILTVTDLQYKSRTIYFHINLNT